MACFPSLYRRCGRGEAKRRRSALAMTAGFISLLGSMGPATASTISHRMPISIAAVIGLSKIDGQGSYVPGIRCLSTLCRNMRAFRSDHLALRLRGTSMANDGRRASQTKRRGVQAVNDDLEALGPLMNEIGQVLAQIADGEPEGVFLYVEIGRGWISSNVFKDEGDAVRNLDSNSDLDHLLWDAWYAAPKGKRWSVMEYDIKGGKFEVAFKYPEEIDVETFDPDHREAALRTRYGDKPVVYPPPPEGAFELKH